MEGRKKTLEPWQYGELMKRLAARHCAPAQIQLKQGGRVLQCPAFYRGGDDPSHLWIYLDSGGWTDAGPGEQKGSARRMAQLLGYPNLRAMLLDVTPEFVECPHCGTDTGWHTDGCPGIPVTPPLPVAPMKPQGPSAPVELLDAAWPKILAHSRRQVMAWLHYERGLTGDQLRTIPREMIGQLDGYSVQDVPAWWDAPREDGFRWLSYRTRQNGIGLVSPLYSGLDGSIRSLAIRWIAPFKGDARKLSILLGTSKTHEGHPVGYGEMARVMAAELVVVVEGLTDTLTALAISDREQVAVVGAIDAGQMPGPWRSWLSAKKTGRVVVVCDNDANPKPNQVTGQAAAEAMIRGIENASLFDWRGFCEMLEIPAQKDLTAAVAVANQRWSLTVIRGAFWEALWKR